MLSLLTVFLGILALGFIVFIHELGHYVAARRVGMRVEVFSIGIGKAIFAWEYKGVKWQIGMIPFGGFLKTAGMEVEDGKDPYEIKDGYFGKGPWARIKVALAGPLVNVVFAFLVFAALWAFGGRSQSFESNTRIIGFVDPTSELAEHGIKPGDTITHYNGEPFYKFKDLLRAGIVRAEKYSIAGEKIDYKTGQKTPYHLELKPYPDKRFGKEINTIGVMNPASYVVINDFLPTEGTVSPLYGSGIEANDRIVWANGETIFSINQLHHIVNTNRALLTIEREGKVLQVRVPRTHIGDLQLTKEQEGELLDWKRELNLEGNLKDFAFIPYEVSSQGEIIAPLSYIDSDIVENEEKKSYIASGVDEQLKQGDRIVAVYGKPLASGIDLLKALKKQKVLMIAKPKSSTAMNWLDQDSIFEKQVEEMHLEQITEQIGVNNQIANTNGLHLLKPVVPISAGSFYKKVGGFQAMEFAQKQKAQKVLGSSESPKYILLGTRLSEQMVAYNPNPFIEMKSLLVETWKTFSALFTGSISPKWFSGPVGMAYVMHEGWKVGLKEALYWMALISLNLGIVNLLPIPVLDGGHICFALWEIVTRKHIKIKTMEKLVVPFVILLVMVFIYTTYHDLTRLFK